MPFDEEDLPLPTLEEYEVYEKKMNSKDYLGDGVYAEFDGYHITLTTENYGHVNVIHLEPKVMEALKKYEWRLTNQG